MSFGEVLEDYGELIEKELREFLGSAVREGYNYHPVIGDIYKSVEEFVLRKGKRLASCSTLVVYEGYNNQIDEKILRVGCGVEIFRHCILAHDDLVDEDTTRREGKTLHKAIEEHKEQYDERFGNSSAVFTGNIILSLAHQAILSSGFEHTEMVKALSLLSIGYRNVNESQILDLLFEYVTPTPNEWNIMASKRAASLFQVTMLMGAELAEASEEDKTLLRDAGEQIGYAFDIQDDIIDTFASEEQYGRKPGRDLVRGKKPLHIILALQKDDELKKLVGKGRELEEEELEQAKKLITDSEALNKAREAIKGYANNAKSGIRNTKMNKEAKDFFISFIDYVEKSMDWYE